MEFKGTKGNWHVCKKNETILCKNDYGVAQIHGVINECDWKYNALLISKAPEMLEMLIKLTDQIDNEHVSDWLLELQDDAKELIKEATEL
jgi:hypothetical protein